MAACSRPAGYAGTLIAHEGLCQENEQVLILLTKDVVSTLSTIHSFWRALGVLQSLLLRQVFVVHLLAAPNLSTLERTPSTDTEP
ncbi:uncharacterized protein B0H64DRAFT_419670 [Chaetomium fimeti]|uniref:Uncharacterized protein n=1 Tax=Chaetomium fimeti TaxID=1854472 RepID=A0AAE0H9C6_9PEZI|nr:hypothetical protein B0H64DRAFT_419670 [Chaetomium fimeti]